MLELAASVDAAADIGLVAGLLVFFGGRVLLQMVCYLAVYLRSAIVGGAVASSRRTRNPAFLLGRRDECELPGQLGGR